MSHLHEIVETLTGDAGIRKIVGEPVRCGDRTVIPLARLTYGFGGGDQHAAPESRERTGGGGGLMIAPLGVLELSPEGARYIPLSPWRGRFVAFAAGAAAALLLARRERRP